MLQWWRVTLNSYPYVLFSSNFLFLDITWDSNPHYRPACIPGLPIHFACILILPSCFTLWSCIWYMNMHCGQPSLIVRHGTGTVRDRYGTGTGQVRDRYGKGTGQVRLREIRHHLPPWWRQKKNRDVINFSIFLFSGIPRDSNPHYRPTCISPYTFAFILILPSCLTLWSCVWKPFWIVRRAVCGQLCLMVRYGTGQIRDPG